MSKGIRFRFAEENDADLYYKWANDPVVRTNSYNQEKISYEDHIKWFNARIHSADCLFYLFLDDNVPAGQVRIMKGKETIIGISIDEKFRGRSMGSIMLNMATDDYFTKYPGSTITAYIKTENTPSFNIFKKAGFKDEEIVEVQGCKSYKLNKKAENAHH
jgi:spore coat polysaccharide biosynthesis protein SpsF